MNNAQLEAIYRANLGVSHLRALRAVYEANVPAAQPAITTTTKAVVVPEASRPIGADGYTIDPVDEQPTFKAKRSAPAKATKARPKRRAK